MWDFYFLADRAEIFWDEGRAYSLHLRPNRSKIGQEMAELWPLHETMYHLKYTFSRSQKLLVRSWWNSQGTCLGSSEGTSSSFIAIGWKHRKRSRFLFYCNSCFDISGHHSESYGPIGLKFWHLAPLASSIFWPSFSPIGPVVFEL